MNLYEKPEVWAIEMAEKRGIVAEKNLLQVISSIHSFCQISLCWPSRYPCYIHNAYGVDVLVK